MPPGINTCITWSVLELGGLLEDEDTRVFFERAQRHLALHPFQLNDLNRALREILDSNVNAYDSKLEGFVLAYKNPKLVSRLGAILHDSCFIHVDVEADFYLFKPEIGCVLKGIANKKAANHIGVLVHKAFNVSIPKPDDCDEWFGDYVFVGQEVKFTITNLDFKGKLPFVRGELIAEGNHNSTLCDESLSVTSKLPDTKRSLKFDEEDSSAPNGFQLESKKKRSKKSQAIENNEDDTIDDDDSTQILEKKYSKSKNESNDVELTKKSKLKISKKRKLIDSNVEETLDNEADVETSFQTIGKRQRVSSETSETESVIDRKKKTKIKSLKLKNVETNEQTNEAEESADTSTETEIPIVEKTKIKSSKRKKSAKEEPQSQDENSETSIDVKPNVESSNVKKSAKKRRSREDSSSDACADPDEPIDVKPTFASLKMEKLAKNKFVESNGNTGASSESEESSKTTKNKNKKIGIVEKSEKNSEQRATSVVDEDDGKSGEDSSSPKKRSKKNRSVDTDDGETTEIEIKSETRTKKKTKTKIKNSDVADESGTTVDTVATNITDVLSAFEFLKPEIKPEHKKKRRRNITENDGTTVATEPSTTMETDDAETIEFSPDRIKTEPDPSDVEDAASKDSSRKKKKKREKTKNENVGTNGNSFVDETFYGNVEIKIEPDASDVEDLRTEKKKLKKKLVVNKLENVKIKEEPNASDVEDSKPKSRFKIEPREEKVNIKMSPRKMEKA